MIEKKLDVLLGFIGYKNIPFKFKLDFEILRKLLDTFALLMEW